MRHMRGFTLVELLVALFVMALVAVLSWRGLDGMVRAHEGMQQRQDQVQALQVGMDQWNADLDAMVELPQSTAIDWNGRVLRLTRASPGGGTAGVVVVGWARRVGPDGSRWTRWASPPVTTRGDLDAAWRRADDWASGNAVAGTASEVAVAGLADWQVFFFRRDAWTNPQSSDATQVTPPATPGSGPTPPVEAGLKKGAIPDGVRIVLTLASQQAITGDLTRDWVNPTRGGGRS
jgi:general secretion pathway protein J